MSKYNNTYRIESNRLQSWDYDRDGYYFITIVTENRDRNLGIVKQDNGTSIVEMSNFGKIVEQEFLESFKIRKELSLDLYVIMPNHIHAIIVLSNPQCNSKGFDCDEIKFIRKPKSISSFIAGFKSSVTSRIDDYIDKHNMKIPKYNRDNHFFQPNYYDHIIRTPQKLYEIQQYILYNPMNWEVDDYNI